MAVFTPIPSARTITAAAVNPGAFQSCRNANRKSLIISFSFVARFCETLPAPRRLTQTPYNFWKRSFGSQCLHGIDVRRAPGRQPRGEKACGDKHQRCNGERDRIQRAHFIEKAAHQFSGRKSEQEAED